MLLLFEVNDLKLNLSSKIKSRCNKIENLKKVERNIKPNGKSRVTYNWSLNDDKKVNWVNHQTTIETLIFKIKSL